MKRILVADDETHILNVVSIKLSNAGYQVDTAEDGAEAYRAALAHPPDLLITDYQMPNLSGVELCAKLAADEPTRFIPTILLTARGYSISPQDKTTAGIKRVIDKPFSPREVLACVEELLAGVEAERPMAESCI
ncbi:MAG: response regulator [Phycisphaerales bacterium]|nr:response regulator [Phycisphaerales bacterium]